ncbi:RNA polymerase sigma factor [Curtobacterium sp. 1P10AnD]|uniref:RNA polymerase sigma factor n=1 Tax=Curtobacterium sp. 1P10AnD TaxID=3132283 RepID=UPI0039A3517E
MIGSRERSLRAALENSAVDLLSYLRRRTDADEAPDLLGETFVVAWRRVDDLPDDAEGTRMWLFGIARVVVLNHARGVRRRWALADRLRGHAALMPATAPPADEHTAVRDAVARLEPDMAELVRLVHWDGFTIADAARVIGVPASTARSRYQRAKELLRSALDPTQDPDACRTSSLAGQSGSSVAVVAGGNQ